MPTKSFFLHIFCLPLLLISAAPGNSVSRQPGYVEDNQVKILFDHQLIKTAEEIQRIYPQLKRDVNEKIGWTLTYRPLIILYGDNAAFQRTVNNPYILAYAVPSKKLIVIDHSKMNMDPFKMETTIKHELCHLILHAHIRTSNLPRWLDEGIAQWASGGIAEVIFQERGSWLTSAVLSGRFIPLGALNEKFPYDKSSFFLSYEQSKSMVEFIIKKYGEEGLRDLLGRLKKGTSFDKSVFNAFSVSLSDLEDQWKKHLRRQATWLTYLINHLYEFLFILGSLLLCYAFVKVWLKKRAMRNEYWSGEGE